MEAVDIVMTGILLSLANRLQMEAVDIVMIGILLSLANRLPLELSLIHISEPTRR